MADTGWKSPIGYEDNTGVSNPKNAYSSDDSYAVFNDYSMDSVEYKISAISIPAGATIKGIEVAVEANTTVPSGGYNLMVQLSKDGGSSFTTAKSSTIKGSTDVNYTYGGQTDLWGTTWSYSDFGSNFRIKLQINATIGDGYFINVDHIRIKVYYTEGGTEANSERKLYTQGRLTGNSEKKLYTQGFNVGNSNRPLYAQGTLEGSSERGLYLQGCLTNNSERTLYIEGYAGDYYSKESSSDLETNDTPLTTQFSEQEYTTVRTDDDNYVDLQGTAQYMKFLFKELNENETNEQKFNITWRGKSSLAPSSATVYLQVYNRTSGQWETLDSNSSSPANTKFTLTGTKSTNLSGYYDSNYVISVRVYQDVT